ncbi:MAG: hypothetical protein FJY29_10430 [Betaproteobacteria bacterium]|nr:hypothetical protein [Betaproteobacteria bacterium]
MFDKNHFKEAFRSWVQRNPAASEQEALDFCQANIPASCIASHFWLIEQSVQWFKWVHQTRAIDDPFFESIDATEARKHVC